MFGFFKRHSKRKSSSRGNSQAEFQRLTRELYDKFALEDTPYDELLDAMAAVENEMNRNGGGNWNSVYTEYLDIIRDHLLADRQFSSAQFAKIQFSINELAECGRELEERGESSRAIEDSIDYLVGRVVDWCHAHPTASKEEA